MSTQRQISTTDPLPVCACGKAPRAYITLSGTSTKFHIECAPCSHATPKFYVLDTAQVEFERMMNAVREDSLSYKAEDVAA